MSLPNSNLTSFPEVILIMPSVLYSVCKGFCLIDGRKNHQKKIVSIIYLL